MSDSNYDSFEKWVEGMTDIEFEEFIRTDATPRQKQKALDIREEGEEEEIETLDDYQEYKREGLLDAIKKLFRI